eukprot:Trichotokara_eunicae@DN6670_c0_g1_i1.p1
MRKRKEKNIDSDLDVTSDLDSPSAAEASAADLPKGMSKKNDVPHSIKNNQQAKKKRSFWTRFWMTWAMIFPFCLIVALGHVYVSMLIGILVISIYKEVIDSKK